jgi:hypothetical protein
VRLLLPKRAQQVRALQRVLRVARFQFAGAPLAAQGTWLTGEVVACQYGQKEGSIGVTVCFPSGEGAGRQDPSEYGLIASRHEHEAGVFRVDYRSGAVSICYVFDDKVVCTPPDKAVRAP